MSAKIEIEVATTEGMKRMQAGPGPLKYALVPVKTTCRMQAEFSRAEGDGFDHALAALIEASPGNALLERIVRALKRARALALNQGYKQAADRIGALLNEIGERYG